MNFKQSKEWELLFKKVVGKAKRCPAIYLCSNNSITPEQIDNSAGNHIFDDYFEFWEISEKEGHSLRAVFQTFSIRRDPDFRKYIQDLIDNCFDFTDKNN